MASRSNRRTRGIALILGIAGLTLAASSAGVTAQSFGGYRETPSAALDRHIRVLARSPKDFLALIGAGKAALAVGDTHAAVGFFGRADEVYPSSALPQVGMGAAMVSDGDAYGAMPYFARAQQLGATAATMGADRGLAYDLTGRHSEAQADYRAALAGNDSDEARRRLALSLAISGDKARAMETLAPLAARGDMGAIRARALVLALSGDLEGARRALDSVMPGSAAGMTPFFAKLPALRSDQKAAAVNLGIFPSSGQPSYAYASPPPPISAPPISAPPVSMPTITAQPPARSPVEVSASGTMPMSGDRLASIDELLRPRTDAPSASPTVERPVQVASIPPAARSQSTGMAVTSSTRPRVWVQLASGSNPEALPGQFRRMKSRYRDLLDGISGYVAEVPGRSRLLIGPFKDSSDANVFVEDLESVSVDAFSWTSPPGLLIRKLPTE